MKMTVNGNRKKEEIGRHYAQSLFVSHDSLPSGISFTLVAFALLGDTRPATGQTIYSSGFEPPTFVDYAPLAG